MQSGERPEAYQLLLAETEGQKCCKMLELRLGSAGQVQRSSPAFCISMKTWSLADGAWPHTLDVDRQHLHDIVVCNSHSIVTS